MSYYNDRRSTFAYAVLIPLAVTAAIIAVLVIIWLIGLLVAEIWPDSAAVMWRDTLGMIHSSLFPGGIPTPAFWILLSILLAVMILSYAYNRDYSAGIIGISWTLAVLMVLGTVGLGVGKGITNDILASDYYLTTTTFKTSDTENLPSILKKYADNGSLRVEVEQGELPTSWVPRVASATGALNVITKTGDAVNNTDVMDDTVTYLYGEGKLGVWTAIRNGANQQNIYGVSSWNGTGDRIATCRFTGEYALNKAFNGMYDKNLWNTVAGTYSSFYYDESDMWGYCDGEKPIIVIPGVNLSSTDMRTIDTAGGVITIEGSPDGTPVLNMHTKVKAGEFPGPVYPQRLVDSQRDSLDWAADFWQSVNEHFGFDVTNVESQAGNNSNYLMKNEADGRLYWVTPLKPQSTSSQTLIAYSIIPADEISASKLNPQVVYVLNEDDIRVVNQDDLLKRVKSSLCEADTNFCGEAASGNIVEFLPVTDTQWQVFGEIGGRVKYRIDVDVDARIEPRVIDVETGTDQEVPIEGEGSPAPSDATGCNNPSTLTDQQLADCLSGLVDELNTRSKE